MSDQEYDVIVIGAGPTGENVADRARRGGLSVAVAEAELAGGPSFPTISEAWLRFLETYGL